MPNGQITILIVDDHTLVRQGLREILDSHGDMAVVGEAGDSGSAVALAATLRPHIVLLDVEIPGEVATTTVRRIGTESPESQVIILSMYDGPRLLHSLLDAGACGYLLKSVTREELAWAIRHAKANDDQIVLAVSKASITQVNRTSSGALSQREQEVLELVARGFSNTQIASRLSLVEATVKRHLCNIYAKLGAVSRIDAVNKAKACAYSQRPPCSPPEKGLPGSG